MNAVRTCPKCGAELPPGMTPWLCPKCLLDRVIDGETSAGEIEEQPHGEKAPGAGAVDEMLPRALGHYELLERVGQGGMGIVYRARQVSLDRIVAVKVLSTLSSKEYVHRFRTEAVAAGSLQHPNIVAIHEVGLWEGHHYLVMDYVAGPTFADLTRDGPLHATRAARYVRVIAEAIHFAHERGILHRDLKPSNVLLDAHDQPRVTDFGLAKRLTDSQLTLTGQVLGSPSYMPPEQASGHRGRVGRSSDVYGLGALLFHLLTGRPPFVSETLPDTLRQVLDEEPLSPRLLNPAVPVDLETICLKCMEKDPERRYATAQALAEELGRFLRDEPVLARPVSPTGKVWRWCRRNPRLAALSAAVLGLLLVVAIGSPLAVFRINEQRLTAVDQTRRADLHAYAARINSAQQYLKARNLGRARELLELVATNHSIQTPDPRGWEWAYLRGQSRSDAEYVFERLPSVCKLEVSPDGRFLALALRYGQVHVWDLTTRRLLDVLGQEHESPTLATFSPDSQRVAFIQREPTRFVFWNLATRAVQMEWIVTNGLGGAFFVPGRPELIEAGIVGPDMARRLALRDLATRDIKAVAMLGTTGGRLFAGNELRFTPDARRVLQGDLDGKVKVYDARTLDLLGSIAVHDDGVSAMALAPGGRLLATAQVDRGTAIHLWDFEAALKAAQAGQAPQAIARLLGHEDWVSSVSFSPDGQLLASASVDHSIRIWDVISRQEQRRLYGHENEVYSVQFAPDGRLYSVGKDGMVCAWSLATPPRRIGPERRSLALTDVDPAPAGRTLAVLRRTGEIGFLDAGAGGVLDNVPGLGTNSVGIEYAAEGRLLCIAQQSGEVVVWNCDERRVVHRLPGNRPARFCKAGRDTELVLAVDEADQVVVWDGESGHLQARWAVGALYCCALSPNAALFASGHERGRVEIWDVRTGKHLRSLTHSKERTTALAFAPDGRFLAAASWAGPVTVWECDAFRALPVLSGHGHSTYALAFSPDGRRLATGSQGRDAVKLWDTATWQELVTIEAADHSLKEVAFTADGIGLVGLTESGDLLIWEALDPSGTLGAGP